MYALRFVPRSTAYFGCGLQFGIRQRAVAVESLAPASRRRGVSATSSAEAPVAEGPGVGMEEGKKPDLDDPHKTMEDVMSHPFGEGYATRCDEEGFGGIYGENHPVFHSGTKIHPGHPEFDKTQGSEVKEKEKARNWPDGSHAK